MMTRTVGRPRAGGGELLVGRCQSDAPAAPPCPVPFLFAIDDSFSVRLLRGVPTAKPCTCCRKTDNIIGKPIGGEMDWENPLRSIAATVDADVLEVLAGTHASVTGNQLAGLAGRSYAQVSAVVRRLTEEGIVLVEQHGRTYSYRLNRDHILASGLLDILSAPSRIENEIRELVRAWDLPPDTVALFGSAARRQAVRQSDVDLLVVRPDDIDLENDVWRGQLGDLVVIIEERCGNRVQLVEVSRSEIADAIETGEPLIESLRREARTLVGEDLRAFLSEGGRR